MPSRKGDGKNNSPDFTVNSTHHHRDVYFDRIGSLVAAEGRPNTGLQDEASLANVCSVGGGVGRAFEDGGLAVAWAHFVSTCLVILSDTSVDRST